ncbi:MAG: magnesium/cobalt transporter CorA [Thermoanaerobaculia bacterium]|nr:magnesium/cobalt transporter CorA [Thermoanaerobaculia bacterium]
MALFGHRYNRPGSAPGLVPSASRETTARAKLHLLDYDPDKLAEREVECVEDAFVHLDDGTVTWLDIVGIGDVETIEKLGEHLGIHTLVLEDLVNLGQRPKLEEYDNVLFIVLRLIHEGHAFEAEQISLLVGPSWVITLQEREGDCFSGVRDRIRQGRTRIRGSGSDYLAYALVDAVVDHFFPLLESYGERIEAIEDEIAAEPGQDTLARIHATKKELLVLRRAAWPQRDVVDRLERLESELVTAETRVFVRDCYDHAVQIMDIVDNYRDFAGDLADFYLSNLSHRTNEVMKVLTIMASIFIPLTFIAGIYGMNFNPDASPLNMPELNWRWGYPGALAAMVLLGVAMVVYFRVKRWL